MIIHACLRSALLPQWRRQNLRHRTATAALGGRGQEDVLFFWPTRSRDRVDIGYLIIGAVECGNGINICSRIQHLSQARGSLQAHLSLSLVDNGRSETRAKGSDGTIRVLYLPRHPPARGTPIRQRSLATADTMEVAVHRKSVSVGGVRGRQRCLPPKHPRLISNLLPVDFLVCGNRWVKGHSDTPRRRVLNLGRIESPQDRWIVFL